MLPDLGVNFYTYPNKYEEEHQKVIRQLASFGVPSSGDLASDKELLKKIERIQLDPVNATTATKTENFTLNTDYAQNEPSSELENERPGAEQLGQLMKIRLGLI